MKKLNAIAVCFGLAALVLPPAQAAAVPQPDTSIGLIALGGGMTWPKGTTPEQKAAYKRANGDSAATSNTGYNKKKQSSSTTKKVAKKPAAANINCPSSREATGKRVFVFHPRMAGYCAYNESGKLVRSGRASGGSNYCADVKRSCRTPQGHFAVQSKGPAGCRSSRYPLGKGGAPMPYCTFFSKNYAIHGSPHVPRYNASHGCVRVTPSDMHWLHHNFFRNGTRVIVTSY